MSESDLTPVSVTQGDRVLTGVGADPDQMAQTMERHAPEGSEPEVTSEPEKPTHEEKQSRGQKRFSQLTSERDKEKYAREAAERERDELIARIAAADVQRAASAAQGSDQSRRDAAVEQTRPATRSKPLENEIGTKYRDYAEFTEDLADWKVEQRLAALDFDARIRSSIEADRASRTADQRIVEEISRGRQQYKDFDAVVTAPHLLANHWPDAIIQAVNSLPEPEHIRYALGKDPDLAERIRTMNPILVGMELAKLMPAPAVVSPASTAGAGTVHMPPPYQPVGSGSKTTAPPLADLPKKGGFDFDKSGYRERRAAERGATRRR